MELLANDLIESVNNILKSIDKAIPASLSDSLGSGNDAFSKAVNEPLYGLAGD
jgi:hypothetical protein